MDFYKIRISPEALELMAKQQGCTVEVGEPDSEGFVNPTFTQAHRGDRTFTTHEIGDALVRIYNAAILMHAEGATSHDEQLGAKSAIVGVLGLLGIEYRFEPQNGRPPSAEVEEVVEDKPFTPRVDEGPANA